MQTLAAIFMVYWLMGPHIFVMISLLIYNLFFTPCWWVGVVYMIYYYYDMGIGERGGRYHSWIRQLSVYRYFVDYFPMKLVKTHDLDPEKTYLFGYHPHGIMSYGAFIAFGTDQLGFHKLFPGITPRLLTLNCNFYVPIVRDSVLAHGICSASKKGIISLLKQPKGVAAVLVVGGADESLNCGDKACSSAWTRSCTLIWIWRKHNIRSSSQCRTFMVAPISGFEQEIPHFYNATVFWTRCNH
jgi:hypothetical protein